MGSIARSALLSGGLVLLVFCSTTYLITNQHSTEVKVERLTRELQSLRELGTRHQQKIDLLESRKSATADSVAQPVQPLREVGPSAEPESRQAATVEPVAQPPAVVKQTKTKCPGKEKDVNMVFCNQRAVQAFPTVAECIETLSAPSNNKLPDFIKRIDSFNIAPFGKGAKVELKFGQWNVGTVADTDLDTYRDDHGFDFACPGTVAIDVGAHAGDSPLTLAANVGPTGLVLAFEPAPPFEPLKFNAQINPNAPICVHKFAMGDADEEWPYESGCGGCNGGRQKFNHQQVMAMLEQRQSSNFILGTYGKDVISRISFIKTDTEGWDASVLLSFMPLVDAIVQAGGKKPTFLVEWFNDWRNRCRDKESRELFQAVDKAGYVATIAVLTCGRYNAYDPRSLAPLTFEDWKNNANKPCKDAPADLLLSPKGVAPKTCA